MDTATAASANLASWASSRRQAPDEADGRARRTGNGRGMEDAVRNAVEVVIPVIEAIGAFIIAFGVAVAFLEWVGSELRLRAPLSGEGVRLTLGRFLALGLEFQLGADVLHTAVSPSWDEIGRLGAIAGIRTVLNYFLAQDLERARTDGTTTSPEHRNLPSTPAQGAPAEDGKRAGAVSAGRG
jgi:uncharacterized membrane protein